METPADVPCSSVLAMKDVQNSPQYEGFDEALEVWREVMKEIEVGTPIQREIGVSDSLQAVEDAIAQLSVAP